MKLRVAAATLNQTPLDWPGNLRSHILSNKALVTVAIALPADVPVQLPDECVEDYRASLVGFDLVLRQQLGVSRLLPSEKIVGG